MNFFHNELFAEYKITSKTPWDIICLVSYYMGENSEKKEALNMKIALQTSLINCIIKEVAEINTKSRKNTVLNTQLECVKSMPNRVWNVLLKGFMNNKVKCENETVYSKLVELCTAKQSEIERSIKQNDRIAELEKDAVINR